MFLKLRAALGLDDKADVSTITDAQMTAAEATITRLETEAAAARQLAADADARAATAATALGASQVQVATLTADLKASADKVATLETWKKNQDLADGRDEDASNDLDRKAEVVPAYQQGANDLIAQVKARLGEK